LLAANVLLAQGRYGEVAGVLQGWTTTRSRRDTAGSISASH
jgi:hypothetical protein